VDPVWTPPPTMGKNKKKKKKKKKKIYSIASLIQMTSPSINLD
jgi:hypothetical protein